MSMQRWVAAPPAIALSTSPKTCIMLIAGASDRIEAIRELGVSVDSATPIITVELMESTQASNGTAGTDFTSSLKQVGGFTAGDTTGPAQVTCRHTYTSEPTVLTRLKAWRFQGPGPFVIQSPLGYEIQSLLSGSTKYKGLALRLTASVGTPNADCYIEWE